MPQEEVLIPGTDSNHVENNGATEGNFVDIDIQDSQEEQTGTDVVLIVVDAKILNILRTSPTDRINTAIRILTTEPPLSASLTTTTNPEVGVGANIPRTIILSFDKDVPIEGIKIIADALEVLLGRE